MSRIIKANHLVLQPPTILEYQRNHYTERPEQQLYEEKSGLETSESVEEFTPQTAEELIAETKEMVQELLNTARRQAEAILDEARSQAGEIVNQAMEDAKQQEREAYEAGFTSGRAAGKETGEREGKEMLEQAETMLTQARIEKERILASVEPEIIKLAIAIAKRIIETELSMHPAILRTMVLAGLKKLQESDEVTIKVNPDDYEVLKGYGEEVQRLLKGIRKLSFEVKADLVAGDFLIESSAGNIDGKIDSQLREVQDSLMDVSQSGEFC